MKFLTKLLNFYLYSSLHISIAAACLAINSFIIFEGVIDWSYICFVFSATLLLYSLHRIIGIKSMSSFKDVGRFKIINAYKSHIIIYSILALLFSNYIFFQFGLTLKLLLIVPSVISLAYVLPLFKNNKRLRDFDNIKIFLIAFSWAYVSVVIPGLLSEEINITLILIKSLESGLQYEVLTEGEGPKPNPNSRVRTHYHGTLIDGTIFDSSVQRGEPISFGLNQVIRAWQEALPLMNVGSKYRIFSPYNLAYGERGAGPVIKPFSALIFEIELLGIE